MLSTIFAALVKALSVTVKIIVTYGIKALMAARAAIQITASFAGTVALKAGATAAVAKGVSTAVKVGAYAAANYGTTKLVEKVPEPIKEPVRILKDVALLFFVV